MRESERPWNCNEQEQRARQRGRQRAGRQTHAPAGGLLPRQEGIGAERGNQPPSRQRIRVALIRVVARLRGRLNRPEVGREGLTAQRRGGAPLA